MPMCSPDWKVCRPVSNSCASGSIRACRRRRRALMCRWLLRLWTICRRTLSSTARSLQRPARRRCCRRRPRFCPSCSAPRRRRWRQRPAVLRRKWSRSRRNCSRGWSTSRVRPRSSVAGSSSRSVTSVTPSARWKRPSSGYVISCAVWIPKPRRRFSAVTRPKPSVPATKISTRWKWTVTRTCSNCRGRCSSRRPTCST